MVVDVDARPSPLGILVAIGRERLERRTVQILEETAAAALSAASRGAIASRTSDSEKNQWLRNGARTHRPTFWTAASTFALSIVRECRPL